jgi:WD40 repeat protein/energy-coupling factor transporter ATP-binding protein EcfA2
MESLSSQKEPSGRVIERLAGRQRQVFDLLSLFQNSQLVGLFGENGSGKSSLIKQGLIPEMEKGFLGIAGRKWKSVIIRPGVTPLENLAAGIAQLGLEKGKQKLEDEVFLAEAMRATSDGLKNACSQKLGITNAFNSLVVIDNFEDLFQYREVATNQFDWDQTVKSFIQNISKCVGNSNLPVYFLIVLRADYMSRLFEYRTFYETLSSSQYNLPQFRKSEFSELVQTHLEPSQKTISKDANDLVYNHFGKDLKNLMLVKIFLNQTIEILNKSFGQEITLEAVQQVSRESLYSDRLEVFYNNCGEIEKKLLEKLLKQITVTQEGTRLRKPIRIDHFLQVTGSNLKELSPLLQTIQHNFPFLLDVVLPYQERLEIKDHSVISDSAVIDIKNEQFIPQWPRLVEWIKEEKESQDLYKRLSEKATLFDKGLTDYLKTPDLDLALEWYETQQPDELWSKQFDDNHHRTIAYLLTSKVKFQDEILKKEQEQKEKLKQLRKLSVFGLLGGLVILLVIGVFAFDAKSKEVEAQKARELAVKETEKARLAKERADTLFIEAEAALELATINEKLANIESNRARIASENATKSAEEARNQLQKTKEANEKIEKANQTLQETRDDLVNSNDKEKEATKRAENARAYQETLNAVLSLRNKVQKKDFLEEEMRALLDEVQKTYDIYKKNTLAFKEANLPNNDLYQLLLELRRKLVESGKLSGMPSELASVKSGLRKISVSSAGSIATGGDDGILLYSKRALGQGSVPLSRFTIDRERIRSLEFINAKEVIIGTVSGKIFQFNTTTGVNKVLEVGLAPNQIVEQLIASSSGVFGLVASEVIKIDINNPSKPVPVAGLTAKSLFKLNEEKLLVIGKDNSLTLLDMASLQTQPISADLKKSTITAAISFGQSLYLGMESGDIAICRTLNLGNVFTVRTEFIIPAHKTRITSLAYDPTSQKLFSASLDQTANIFDLSLKRLSNDYVANYSYKIEGFDKWIWDFALVPTGKVKTLLTVDESGEIKTWQTGATNLYEEIFSSAKK